MWKLLSTFVAVLAAIVVAVVLFAPERLPPGIGLQPVPVDVTVSKSLVGQVLGQDRTEVTVTNAADRPLHNVTLALRARDGRDKKTARVPQWPPGESRDLGWMKGWEIQPEDRLEISASGYYAVTWRL